MPHTAITNTAQEGANIMMHAIETPETSITTFKVPTHIRAWCWIKASRLAVKHHVQMMRMYHMNH